MQDLTTSLLNIGKSVGAIQQQTSISNKEVANQILLKQEGELSKLNKDLSNMVTKDPLNANYAEMAKIVDNASKQYDDIVKNQLDTNNEDIKGLVEQCNQRAKQKLGSLTNTMNRGMFEQAKRKAEENFNNFSNSGAGDTNNIKNQIQSFSEATGKTKDAGSNLFTTSFIGHLINLSSGKEPELMGAFLDKGQDGFMEAYNRTVLEANGNSIRLVKDEAGGWKVESNGALTKEDEARILKTIKSQFRAYGSSKSEFDEKYYEFKQSLQSLDRDMKNGIFDYDQYMKVVNFMKNSNKHAFSTKDMINFTNNVGLKAKILLDSINEISKVVSSEDYNYKDLVAKANNKGMPENVVNYFVDEANNRRFNTLGKATNPEDKKRLTNQILSDMFNGRDSLNISSLVHNIGNTNAGEMDIDKVKLAIEYVNTINANNSDATTKAIGILADNQTRSQAINIINSDATKSEKEMQLSRLFAGKRQAKSTLGRLRKDYENLFMSHIENIKEAFKTNTNPFQGDIEPENIKDLNAFARAFAIYAEERGIPITKDVFTENGINKDSELGKAFFEWKASQAVIRNYFGRDYLAPYYKNARGDVTYFNENKTKNALELARYALKQSLAQKTKGLDISSIDDDKISLYVSPIRYNADKDSNTYYSKVQAIYTDDNGNQTLIELPMNKLLNVSSSGEYGEKGIEEYYNSNIIGKTNRPIINK